MESWHEVARIPNAIPTRRDPMPTSLITARAFDSDQDLLWSGDGNVFKGRVASYYRAPTGLMRYTSFKAQPEAVADIVTTRAGVITASNNCIRLHNRRGIIKQTVKDDSLSTIYAMGMLNKATSEVLVGGDQDLAKINIDRGIVTSKVPHTTGTISRIKRGGMLVGAGLENGQVEIVDPNTMQIVKTFVGHQGPIVDMDFSGTTLITCGYSSRKTGYYPDTMVNVYDIRAMKPMTPISFPGGALFAKIHPKLSTCCMITGSTGQIQFLDMLRPTEVQIQQAAIATAVTGMDLSFTGDYMVLSDGDGFLQLWTNDQTGESQFTDFPTPLEFPTAADDYVTVDDHEPLSKVGMPYYKEELLSSWSDKVHIGTVGMPPSKIDADLERRMCKDKQGFAYAANTKKIPRNLKKQYVPLDSSRRSSVTVPKFKSEKERTGVVEDKSKLFDETVMAGRIAKAYKKLEIKYSKFGISDFDFDFYNSTIYSGLETQLSNSYCNALLQLFRFSPFFYNFALNSVANVNNNQPNLLCELGLLFDMLHKGNGRACKAGNFLKTLKSLPEANAYLYDDLLSLERKKNVSDGVMVQQLCQYMLRQVTHESQGKFFDVAGIPMTTTVKRLPCGVESQQEEGAFNINLVPVSVPLPPQSSPPQSQSANSMGGRKQQQNMVNAFIQSLRKGLERWTQSNAYCDHCGDYQAAGIMQTVRSLPKLLTITVPQEDSKMQNMWVHEPSWPLKTFYAASSRGKLMVRADGKGGGTRYNLVGMLCGIGSYGEPDNHLVTIAKTDDGWHLFNDFLVKKLSEQEAFDFSMKWKIPVILLYQEHSETRFDYSSWQTTMDTSILYRDFFIQGEMEGYKREYKLLTGDEAPKPGTLVAMDAEFVKLQEEEIEISSDGGKSLLMPTMLSLARVSVLRGEGVDEGVPFIDDYIATTEPIVDYLTSFSGIEEGDLDPAQSKKGLVTLQTSYKRLWLLLNLGCVFIGHGLHNDFRTINIQVPDNQVIDTVNIFSRPMQRKLSLKFLAWLLLDEKVQTGDHDSIEDARAALQLYRKSQKLVADGTLESTVDFLYDEGRKTGFKPPHANNNPMMPAAPGSMSRATSYSNLASSAPGTPY